jgi:hypothetical protein
MAHSAHHRALSGGTDSSTALAPGIDGEQDLEVELDETEKAEEGEQLPQGEFRKNKDLEPGEIAQPPAAMRAPPAASELGKNPSDETDFET